MLALTVIMTCFTACKKEETTESDSNYLANVNNYSFWSNTADTAIAEYNTYNHVHAFLDECEIVNGDAVAPNGKIRKVLFLDWDQYLDVNLKEEVKYVMDNNLPMVFCDLDRAKADKLKDTYAESLELYNFVAPETPYSSSPYDTSVRDFVIDRMEQGDDVITGIFHNIDSAGHNYGFGISTQYTGTVMNCDMYANSILNAIERREQNYNEEWLIVCANDHGGIGKGHSSQTLEERTTWLASNIPFDEKYFSSGYDGFNVK